MLVLYSFFIRIYYGCLFILSFFNEKASDWIKGRKGQFLNIKSQVLKWEKNPIIWIHAASYGEFEMSRPIIDALRKKDNTIRFVVSFYSPSGFNNITLDEDNFLKIYLPLDLKKKHFQILKVVNPKAVIFIKYEFWFNLLSVLKTSNIPFYFTSLHLNEDSYLLKPFFSNFKTLLVSAKKIYCHNPHSIEILQKSGFENLDLFGDSRIEQVSKNKIIDTHNIDFKNDNMVIAFGSVTDYEVPSVIDFCNKHQKFNFIIAPHDVSTIFIEKMSSQLYQKTQTYSTLAGTVNNNILIVDTYGDLRYLYRNANLAYVGAGFEKGPHNVLEPLIYNVPVCIGKNITKFPMAQYLNKIGLVRVLEKIEDLDTMVSYLKKIDQADFESRCKVFFKQNRTNIDSLVNEIIS